MWGGKEGRGRYVREGKKGGEVCERGKEGRGGM